MMFSSIDIVDLGKGGNLDRISGFNFSLPLILDRSFSYKKSLNIKSVGNPITVK